MAKKAPYADEADYVVVGSGSSGSRDRRPAGRVRRQRDRGRGGQERRAVPGQEARHDRPDALGPRDQEEASTGATTRCRRSTCSTARCRSRAARWSAARARSTAWSTSAATAPTTTPGRPRATPAGTPTRVNAAYKRMEDFEDGANDYRGAGGPIRVTRNKTPQEGSLQFIQAASDVLGVQDPRRLQRGVAGGRQPDAAERRRRPALLRLARLHPHLAPDSLAAPDARRWPPGSSSRTAARSASRSPTSARRAAAARGPSAPARRSSSRPASSARAQLLMLSGIGHAQHLARPRHRRWSRTCRSATTCTTTCSTR